MRLRKPLPAEIPGGTPAPRVLRSRSRSGLLQRLAGFDGALCQKAADHAAGCKQMRPASNFETPGEYRVSPLLHFLPVDGNVREHAGGAQVIVILHQIEPARLELARLRNKPVDKEWLRSSGDRDAA